ncbi:hypothetical protein OIV83_002347 [Microbotryomycetes sp. JL201]|nr:hypothetical protein OIV83_002347 [Microbotryomycetes sp. JL201]
MSRWRRITDWLPTKLSSQLFLGMTALETVVDIVIVAVLLNSFEDKIIDTIFQRNEDSVLPVYLGLFVLAHIVQLALAIDAIVAKNTIQVASRALTTKVTAIPDTSPPQLALNIFNTLFLAYSIIQISELRALLETQMLRILVWLIPVMISLTEATYIGTFWFIWRDFGWQIFKEIGADRSMKRAYAWYHVFLTALKFDWFFLLSFSLQLVLLVLRQSALERGLTIAAMPITLLILIAGYIAVRKEINWLFYSFEGGCCAGVGYFVYKIFMVYQRRKTDYLLVFKSLTVFAVFCLLVLLFTIFTSTMCFRNFGRGLRYHLMKDNTVKLGDGDEMDEYERWKTKNRMSID